jgi:hypothetical protein
VTVFSRRNALIGWLVLSVVRRRIRRRASRAIAGMGEPDLLESPRRHPFRSVVVVGAVAGGSYALWRLIHGGSDDWESYTPPEGSAAPPSSDGGPDAPA